MKILMSTHDPKYLTNVMVVYIHILSSWVAQTAQLSASWAT